MAEVEETPLPGIGVRYELTTKDGRRIGVLAHRSGRRDLLVYDDADPDTCIVSLALTADEARSLNELLGGPQFVERLEAMKLDVEGLAFAWATVPADGRAVDQTVGELRLRTETGASAVAVMRGDRGIPIDGPEFRIHANDTVVVVGPSEGVTRAEALLSS